MATNDLLLNQQYVDELASTLKECAHLSSDIVAHCLPPEGKKNTHIKIQPTTLKKYEIQHELLDY